MITPFLHSAAGPEAMYDYDLFAVINHEGQMNNGHYTNFARYRDEVRGDCAVQWISSILTMLLLFIQWYRFDDDKYVFFCL